MYIFYISCKPHFLPLQHHSSSKFAHLRKMQLFHYINVRKTDEIASCMSINGSLKSRHQFQTCGRQPRNLLLIHSFRSLQYVNLGKC